MMPKILHDATWLNRTAEPDSRGSFGSLLRAARVQSGKSLRQLAAHLGLSPTFLSLVERDKIHPMQDADIARAAAFVGVGARGLIAAASVARGAAKLAIVDVSDRHRIVGTTLARVWRDLTEEQLAAIAAVIETAAPSAVEAEAVS